MELTAAGIATTRRLLLDAGYDAPAVGGFAESTAIELFAGTDFDDFPMLWSEIEVIGRLWRSRSTATHTVLAVIGEIHPTKVVSEAARKAGFQRRSRLRGL